MAFTHTKKVDIGIFIKARIRIRIRSQTSVFGSRFDQKGPDPTGSRSAILPATSGYRGLICAYTNPLYFCIKRTGLKMGNFFQIFITEVWQGKAL
jgi:hypothetical protein